MPDKSTNYKIPPGFTLQHTLRGHTSEISRIAWSPDGKLLASPSADDTIRLWDALTGQHLQTLKGHFGYVYSVAWSPDRKILASSTAPGNCREYQATTYLCVPQLRRAFN